ncbi:MAG: hypothetical protein EG823_00960 [Actinobacteria bacterium]|nr:hypothetical protein [Actinomycetota bacterium]
MAHWLALLAGCVLLGAGIVAALVAPRRLSLLVAAGVLLAIVAATMSVGVLSARYGSARALAGAIAVLVAGAAAGYAIAAAALPHLAPASRPPDPGPAPTEPGGLTSVVLLSHTEPESYSARIVAARYRLLAESAGIEVPATALPLVFLAEKGRYRELGGKAPGPAAARDLQELVDARLPSSVHRTEQAWTYAPDSLASTVVALRSEGARRAIVVSLGPPQSGHLEVAQGLLETAVRGLGDMTVTFATTLFNDRDLPAHLASRIMSSAADLRCEDIGVVLVNQGMPPVWEKRSPAASEAENYFNQRVRMLLAERGVTDRHVRVAWLNWQTPDVTEAVRHVAALGCTRVIVACSTIVLPTLETALDLRQRIHAARVPDTVEVVTVMPHGDDPALADAICRSVEEALEHADR